jgi:hypothetical protein
MPQTLSAVYALGQRAETQSECEEGRAGDAEQLAEEQADDDRPRKSA